VTLHLALKHHLIDEEKHRTINKAQASVFAAIGCIYSSAFTLTPLFFA
jgi:hypothetical protein